MRSRTPVVIQAAAAVAVLLVLLLSGCQAPGSGTGAATSDAALADRLEKLPTLPPDIAATLDPKTNATKTSGPPPAPVKGTGPLPIAPCCSIKDQKSLKVKVSLTKCAPFRDFVLAPIGDLVMAREIGGGGTPGGPAGPRESGANVRAYKLNTVNRADVWNTWVCMTSDGPWDATFIEDRSCVNYSPVDSLFVFGWGGPVAYYWNGGTPNHPAEVSVVSCRDIGTTRLPCGGPGSCDCTSSACPADQPCPCNPPW
jgi:hypothetical protein